MACRIATLILAIFWAVGPALAEDVCGQAMGLAGKGMEVYDRDPKKGLELLGEAHIMCPGSWAVAYNLGLAYYRNGQPALAYAQWKSLESKGSSERLLTNLGWLALELGKVEDAADWLKKRDRAARPNTNSLALSMEILFKQGKYDAAMNLSFTNIRYVPVSYRQKAVEYATEDLWNQFRSGKRVEATERMAALAQRFPDVKSLDTVRDIMVAALLDDTVKLPLPKPLPHLEGGMVPVHMQVDEGPLGPPSL